MKATKLTKGLEHMASQKRLRDPSVQPGEEKVQRGACAVNTTELKHTGKKRVSAEARSRGMRHKE